MAKTAKRIKRIKRGLVAKKVKIKTKRSAAKRYKVTGSGKVKCPHAYRSHLTGKRTRSRKNRLRKGKMLCMSNIKLVKRCLPNSF